MLFLVIFILLATFLAAVLFFAKVSILIEYTRNDWNDYIVLSFIAFWGILEYKYKIYFTGTGRAGVKFRKVKKGEVEGKGAEDEKGYGNLLKLFDRASTFMDLYRSYEAVICDIKKYLRGKVVIKELKLEIIQGTGDAYYTGILGGLVWAAAGSLLAFLSNNFAILKKHVNVKTDFTGKNFKIDLLCIFMVKIVHIIVVGLKLLISHLRKKLKINKITGGDISG